MRLIMVCGLPGSGKSTASRKIAERTGSYAFNTDIVRKQLLGKPEYTEEEKERVYSALLETAEKFLRNGKGVVLDGTFYREDLRRKAMDVAERTGSEFHMVEVVCDDETARKRMEKRKKKGSVSDADFGVYLKLKKQFEPIREKHAVIESGRNEDAQIERFLKSL